MELLELELELGVLELLELELVLLELVLELLELLELELVLLELVLELLELLELEWLELELLLDDDDVSDEHEPPWRLVLTHGEMTRTDDTLL